MSKKQANEKIVDDEMLEKAGAEPEEQTLGDNIEAEIEEQLEDNPVAEDETIAELQAQLAAKDERHLRLYADYENLRKRSAREKRELMDTAGSKTMLALLPVLDDFDRAAKQAATDDETQKVWDSGVGLIVKKLYRTLEGLGLKPMVSDGEAFSSDFHEAVTEIPMPAMAGKVVDTTERGYTLNGKIIRHAKVVVGK